MVSNCSCAFFQEALQPLEIPSECAMQKVGVIAQHASIGLVIVSAISALFSAIILSPSYFFLSIGALAFGLLASYHIRQLLESPDDSVSVSEKMQSTLAEGRMELLRHERPQVNPAVLKRINDHLLLKYLPAALSPERQADLASDYIVDDAPMSQEDMDRLEKEIPEQQARFREREEILKQFIPVGERSPSPVMEEERVVEGMNINVGQADPDLLNRVQDHLRNTYLPNRVDKEKKADLSEDYREDTSKMDSQEVDALRTDLRQQKERCQEREEILKGFIPEEERSPSPIKEDKATVQPHVEKERSQEYEELISRFILLPSESHDDEEQMEERDYVEMKPKVEPALLNRLQDHLRDRYFPDRFPAEKKADLARDYQKDDSVMTAHQADALLTSVQQQKQRNQERDSFLSSLVAGLGDDD